MHQPVLAVLDAIASGGMPAGQLRARAYAEAAALRQVFADPARVPAAGLQVRLASLVEDHAHTGWTIRLVDEEVTAEPPTVMTQAISDVLAGLLSETITASVPGQIRIRVSCDDSGTTIVLRITGCEKLAESAVSRAGARLAMASGTVSLAPALPGEHRILLWAPP
jgi:hypothetical protein